MKPTLNLEWREFRGDDETERNCVLSAWLCSYAECPEFSKLARSTYFALYKPVVERLMATSTIAIAVDPDLPHTIMGFVAIDDGMLHYFHVKPRLRRLGIAKWMLREMRGLPVVYTHQPGRIAMRLVGPEWTYDQMRRFPRQAA